MNLPSPMIDVFRTIDQFWQELESDPADWGVRSIFTDYLLDISHMDEFNSPDDRAYRQLCKQRSRYLQWTVETRHRPNREERQRKYKRRIQRMNHTQLTEPPEVEISYSWRQHNSNYGRNNPFGDSAIDSMLFNALNEGTNYKNCVMYYNSYISAELSLCTAYNKVYPE